MPDTVPKSRRERRAAAASSNKKTSSSSTTTSARAPPNGSAAKTTTTAKQVYDDSSDPDIPMETPDYDAKPQGKTLFQIVDERYAQMQADGSIPSTANGSDTKHSPSSTKDATGIGTTTAGEDGTQGEDPIGPVATAFIYTLTLSTLHITLDVITLTQYQQDLAWPVILARITRLCPALFALVLVAHLPIIKRYRMLRQLGFWVTGVVSGMYLLYAGNKQGYYYVMRRAPPVGTLWVWSCVEMDLGWAVTHAAVVLTYMRVMGFRAF